jgi:ABC-type glutathione transport system ATPase component
MSMASAVYRPAVGADASGLLRVRDLSIEVRPPGTGWMEIVRGVSFDLDRGRTLGIVGESGSGKSLTVRALMGLLPQRSARMSGGSIHLDGEELGGKGPGAFENVRGRRICMVFQDAMSALNPVLTIGYQLKQILRIRMGLSGAALQRRALELLDNVRIANAAERLTAYPHEFSGGMRQRVAIAMAIAQAPEIMIADEPTTALDVTTQRRILELITEIQHEQNLALLLITHDLGVAGYMADDIAVMHGGRILEITDADRFFSGPDHPYSRKLLESVVS